MRVASVAMQRHSHGWWKNPWESYGHWSVLTLPFPSIHIKGLGGRMCIRQPKFVSNNTDMKGRKLDWQKTAFHSSSFSLVQCLSTKNLPVLMPVSLHSTKAVVLFQGQTANDMRDPGLEKSQCLSWPLIMRGSWIKSGKRCLKRCFPPVFSS